MKEAIEQTPLIIPEMTKQKEILPYPSFFLEKLHTHTTYTNKHILCRKELCFVYVLTVRLLFPNIIGIGASKDQD